MWHSAWTQIVHRSIYLYSSLTSAIIPNKLVVYTHWSNKATNGRAGRDSKLKPLDKHF